MRHETICELYRLAEIGRRVEASMGWPLTPTRELVNDLKIGLFGEDTPCTTPATSTKSGRTEAAATAT